MKIPLDKNLLINEFLQPIGRVADECSIHLTDSSIYTLTSDVAESIILYCKIICTTGLTEPITLNLKDVKKLTRVFECVDRPIIEVDVNDNQSVLKYNSPEIKFKLHLVQDNVIRKTKVSIEKILGIQFDTSFEVLGTKINEVLKGSNFSPETSKVYFSQEVDKIYCEITDKAVSDLDSITYEMADTVEGGPIPQPVPINIEALRLIAASKKEKIKIQYNTNFGFFGFSLTDNNSEMFYLIPAMIK